MKTEAIEACVSKFANDFVGLLKEQMIEEVESYFEVPKAKPARPQRVRVRSTRKVSPTPAITSAVEVRLGPTEKRVLSYFTDKEVWGGAQDVSSQFSIYDGTVRKVLANLVKKGLLIRARSKEHNHTMYRLK